MLIWQQDLGAKMTMAEVFAYADSIELADLSDWRLPNVKELQSIVDCTRCPALTHSAAVNDRFRTTSISAPKSGNSAEYPQHMGPQGDVRNVYNYVRFLRVQEKSG